jgi:hypothetical protein
MNYFVFFVSVRDTRSGGERHQVGSPKAEKG